MNRKQLIDHICNYYSEWLEMAGAKAPFIVQNILADALIKERQKSEYLQKRINQYESSKRVSN